MSIKTYQNISRRLVSIPCNSGEYHHLPGGGQLKVDEVEVIGNAMVEKLTKRGVLIEVKSAKLAVSNKPGAASKRSKAKGGESKAE